MRALIATALLIGGMTTGTMAQQPPPRMTIEPMQAPAEPGAIPLPTAAGSPGSEVWNKFGGLTAVRNVTRPTLTPFLPKPDKATGAAMIVAPGGAFMLLAMDHEGWQVARWLADHGVAAFVLKYRPDPTPASDEGFMQALGQRLADAATGERGRIPVDVAHPSTDDALAAIKLVRGRAAEWKIDPKRVGIVGFSAGAMVALRTAIARDASARPDFIAPIYPPLSPVSVPSDAPPMFVALAADDELFGESDFALVRDWRKAKRPVEFHYYDKGGHGFGMMHKATTSDLWIEQLHAWLKSRGLLGGAAQ
jgi:acetyl esterase/lipase